MYLFAIPISSLVKYLLNSYIHILKNQVVFLLLFKYHLLLSCRGSLYLLNMSPLSDKCFANMNNSSPNKPGESLLEPVAA